MAFQDNGRTIVELVGKVYVGYRPLQLQKHVFSGSRGKVLALSPDWQYARSHFMEWMDGSRGIEGLLAC